MIAASTLTVIPAPPVLEFWARVEGKSALVRVFRRCIEWSWADRRLDTGRIPVAFITAVTTERGRFRSTLVVEAEARRFEFRVDNTCAREARDLIRLLLAVFGPIPNHSHKIAGEAAFANELIDLRTSLDDGTVDYPEYEEERARLLGF
jgi:hypothetical protein